MVHSQVYIFQDRQRPMADAVYTDRLQTNVRDTRPNGSDTKSADDPFGSGVRVQEELFIVKPISAISSFLNTINISLHLLISSFPIQVAVVAPYLSYSAAVTGFLIRDLAPSTFVAFIFTIFGAFLFESLLIRDVNVVLLTFTDHGSYAQICSLFLLFNTPFYAL